MLRCRAVGGGAGIIEIAIDARHLGRMGISILSQTLTAGVWTVFVAA